MKEYENKSLEVRPEVDLSHLLLLNDSCTLHHEFNNELTKQGTLVNSFWTLSGVEIGGLPGGQERPS